MLSKFAIEYMAIFDFKVFFPFEILNRYFLNFELLMGLIE